ncbi:MAG: NAD(P)H-hydrate dehydratase [Polyangiaceae bacterium]|nr:NAD(P)H-hydrate dehydratase [Polyangiaceae bacterium]
MRAVLSGQQMRQFDRHVIDACAVPSLVLMENAGRGAADVIDQTLEQAGGRCRAPVLVVCGSGNNGGDGFVVARHLSARGWPVVVYLAAAPDKLKGDARANYDGWAGLGGRLELLLGEDDSTRLVQGLEHSSAVVDALFGTGLDREITGRYRKLIEAINQRDAPCFSLDIPSGLHANTGAVLGVAVKADVTITFAHLKLGLVSSVGAEHAGRVHVADLGVPGGLFHRVGSSAELVESDDVRALLGTRPLGEHKASAGRVVALAGGHGKTGAALLVARGALRAGAGLVTVATFPEAAHALEARVLEEMTAAIDPEQIEASLERALTGVHVVVAGPGFGLDERARRAVRYVLFEWEGTKVLDADALSQFAGRATELAGARGELILTPHPGEMGRLLGISPQQVEQDRFAALAHCVELTGATVLLKGPRTLVGAPDRPPLVNAAGTPALATGGAGDVLAGVLGAFACHLPPRDAAISAAHVHARAAECWSRDTKGDRGLIAHEIADCIPRALAGLSRARPTLPL